jgi:hypothetical protein
MLMAMISSPMPTACDVRSHVLPVGAADAAIDRWPAAGMKIHAMR